MGTKIGFKGFAPTVTVGRYTGPPTRVNSVVKMLRETRDMLNAERAKLRAEPKSKDRDFRLAEISVQIKDLSRKMLEAGREDN